MAQASRDQNFVSTLLGVSNSDGVTPVAIYADPTTHRLLIDSAVGAGTVTKVSVATANGFSGTVANDTSTPTITIIGGAITPTSVNGLTLTSQTIGFTSAGGGTSKTLTVPLDASVSGANTGDETNVTGTSANVTGVVLPANGGTGIANNSASTLTISGNYGTTLTVSNTTAVTLPTTGTLATLAGSEALTNKSINGMTVTASTGTFTLTNAKTLTVSDTTTLATNAITLGGGEVITFSASNALSLLTTGTTVMTFPAVTDTVAVLGTAQTYTATQTEKQVIWSQNNITASGNAATVPITYRLSEA